MAYNSEADIKRAEAEINRKPNQELLEHNRKRHIELKCADFEMLMENKVSLFKKCQLRKFYEILGFSFFGGSFFCRAGFFRLWICVSESLILLISIPNICYD